MVFVMVSVFTAGVSVNRVLSLLALSVLTRVSVLVLVMVDESTLLESADPPVPLALQAAIDMVILAARQNALNPFFMVMIFLM